MAFLFKIKSIISFTSVAVVMSTATLAQTESGSSQAAGASGWGVQCNNTADGLQCAASMNVVSTPDNQRIFSISFQESGEQAEPTLVMQLPFGLNLPRGVDLSIDGGEAQTFAVNTCLQTGCFVVQPAQQSLADRFASGSSLAITMESSNGNETRMELSLEGFTDAIARLN